LGQVERLEVGKVGDAAQVERLEVAGMAEAEAEAAGEVVVGELAEVCGHVGDGSTRPRERAPHRPHARPVGCEAAWWLARVEARVVGVAELGDAGVLEVTGEGGAARPTKRRNPPSRRVRGRGGWVRG